MTMTQHLFMKCKKLKRWVKDELTWEDVYSKKPVEYLEAIARGEDSTLGF